MEIVLSAETEGPAASKWFELQKEFSPLLSQVSMANYGESLTSIGIITILMREEFFEDGGYKERRYYNKKRKEADIRLRLNYVDFLRANKERQREIYTAHILECIRIAGENAGRDFELERLLSDVKQLLNRCANK